MSAEDVIRRWHKLFIGTLFARNYLNIENRAALREAQLSTVKITVEVWPKRLCDISWFMLYLNEYIARLANKEDQCTGRSWEGRFNLQAVLDEAALMAHMEYGDLNPVRACMASKPENSKHTRIQYRINAAKRRISPRYLLPFIGNPRKDMPVGLPFRLVDYIQPIGLTGRHLRDDKGGVISNSEPPILEGLGLRLEANH